jgi:hypothetical protein
VTVTEGAAAPRGTVGIIVNPLAGKDIRRLVSGAGHTSDSTKMGIVARVVAAAAESGARRILLADDPHRLARRAVERLELDDVAIELLSDHVSGSRDDTVSVAAHLSTDGVDVVVVLGGDGTCRDVATGWPSCPLIAISTGTNNVYPSAIDGTSAGVAAGLIASGSVPISDVSRTSKRIVVSIDRHDGSQPHLEMALVDAALVSSTFVGARAVRDPSSIVAVVATIGQPDSTGLSSIAGRVHPVDRWAPGGVFIRLGRGVDVPVRRVRAPLSPGTFDTVEVFEVRALDDGHSIELQGPGVLAFDGERDLPIGEATTVTMSIDRSGPQLIDVARTLTCAAHQRIFDVPTRLHEEFRNAG